MTCPDLHQLHRWHDGELPAAEAASVASHVRQCATCQAELRSLQQIRDVLLQTPMTQPTDAMMRRWARTAPRARDMQIRHFAEWMMAAAAAVVLTIFGLWPDMDSAQATPLLGSVERAMLVSPGEEQLPANLLTARLIAADLSVSRSSTTSTTSGGQP